MRKIVSIMIITDLLLSLGLWYIGPGWTNDRTIMALSGGAIRYVEAYTLDAGEKEWSWSGFTGFETRFVPFVRGFGRWRTGMVFVVLPMWMPTALIALALWICRRPVYRLRRRKRLGQCV